MECFLDSSKKTFMDWTVCIWCFVSFWRKIQVAGKPSCVDAKNGRKINTCFVFLYNWLHYQTVLRRLSFLRKRFLLSLTLSQKKSSSRCQKKTQAQGRFNEYHSKACNWPAYSTAPVSIINDKGIGGGYEKNKEPRSVSLQQKQKQCV